MQLLHQFQKILATTSVHCRPRRHTIVNGASSGFQCRIGHTSKINSQVCRTHNDDVRRFVEKIINNNVCNLIFITDVQTLCIREILGKIVYGGVLIGNANMPLIDVAHIELNAIVVRHPYVKLYIHLRRVWSKVFCICNEVIENIGLSALCWRYGLHRVLNNHIVATCNHIKWRVHANRLTISQIYKPVKRERITIGCAGCKISIPLLVGIKAHYISVRRIPRHVAHENGGVRCPYRIIKPVLIFIDVLWQPREILCHDLLLSPCTPYQYQQSNPCAGTPARPSQPQGRCRCWSR